MQRTEKDAQQRTEARLRGLFLAGLNGEARLYQQFLESLSGHLRAFLRRRLFHSHNDVEDLLQEVLMAVHNARHTYRPEQPLTAWVYAIARYKLMDHLRAHARRDTFNDPLEDHQALFAADDDEPARARRDLHKLLEALPERQRLPIVHVKLQGRSVAETARLTGLSESAVKIGVHRGLKALAARMREDQ
ncbi:RNA polymerase subunit sigma [Alcanivorax sp. N3-2A]|nr:RNA polymerase subunit sigma [Alcanivorax sp. N3-2A]